MANHELIDVCAKCGEEYDVRVKGLNCPTCHYPSVCYGEPKAKEIPLGLFHITNAAMVGAGFTLETDYDRDFTDFNNVKIETYTRQITKELKLEVCFGYRAKTRGEFDLKNSYVQLVVDDTCVELSLNSFAGIIKFCDFLIKST